MSSVLGQNMENFSAEGIEDLKLGKLAFPNNMKM
jgi:hypothetical protein